MADRGCAEMGALNATHGQ